MKLSKKDIENWAKTLSDNIMASAGLRNAKKIAAQIKRNLLSEDKRRKTL